MATRGVNTIFFFKNLFVKKTTYKQIFMNNKQPC